jgi:signal transduction histidine kinase/CheY-like chemotaxis protein
MPNSSSLSERVLVVAPIGRDGPAAAARLGGAGLAAEVCQSLAELRAGLEAGAGVAVIAEEALYREPIDCIVSWVEAQPAWSDFPFVVLTVGHGSSPGDRRVQLLKALRNVSLLERPVQTVTLVSAVEAALRGRRRQYEAQSYLHEREQAAARLKMLVAERTVELEQANRRLRQEIADRGEVEARLRQSQKLEAIGQLTGGVAHDFNNLLSVVLGNLDLAIMKVTNETVRRRLDNAERAARRGAKLTEQLLAFAHKQHLNPQAIDLNALIGGMTDLLLSTVGGTVQIKTALEEDLWPAMVDASQIELVILNLVINSRDAMPDGGCVTVRTANLSANVVRPLDLAPGDYVAVSVSDTGTGMSAEVRAKAFEPFFTTKGVGKGTGLGLSQVYGVARQSGGTVSIDTRFGAGTTITVYLPRTTSASGAATEYRRAAAEERSPRPQAAVLVIDDDPDVREMAIAAVESLGFMATGVDGGHAALELLERSTQIDLMLVDYAMPDLNGIEAVRLIRAKRPGLPFLFMTGYANRDKLEGEAAAERILKKPFTRAELQAAIDAVLRANTDPPTGFSKVVPLRFQQRRD